MLEPKVENSIYPSSKNCGKFKTDRPDDKEELCPLAKLAIQNKI
jgi:hypothetical protein